MVAQEKQKHLTAKAAAWQRFVATQVGTGGAISHRLAKRDATPCADCATMGRGAWCKLEGQATAQWRSKTTACTLLPPITAQHVADAARTFKASPSTGCDDFPPKALADTSDQLRGAVASFLETVERTGS